MDKLLDQIESLETQAQTGIASTTSMFKQIAIGLVPKDLFNALEDYKVRDKILARIKHRAADVPDVSPSGQKYLHNYDAAIATYLLLLQLKGDWIRIYVALQALEGMEGGWWSIRVALELQDVVQAMSEPQACEDLVDRPVEMGSSTLPRTARAGA